jgi:choline dehydrogenase-like flavoprotein
MQDFIIVGAGSAGCAIAARLTEFPDVRVLLLEAGPTDSNPFIHFPVGFYKIASGPLTWGLTTAPQRHAMDREIPYSQGRVLGGGSSINAEVFTRGCPEDYDAWENKFGCDGWSFEGVKPYFIRSEDNDTLVGDFHGVGGPLSVSTMDVHMLTRAFVQSCQQLGMPYNSDFNAKTQLGTAAYQTTTRGGKRCSAATGYLKPTLDRPNLTLRTGVEIIKIVIERGRAIGVEIIENGQSLFLRAEREVIVSAGAIGSPKLLLHSGIGPANHLSSVGVEVKHDLPGVGENLHDHYGVDIVCELGGPYSLDKYNKLHWMAFAALEYALFRKGPIASTIVEGGAFWYADRAEPTPDLQFHFLIGGGVEVGVPKIPSGSGVTLNSYMLRPKARGSVKLRSNDSADTPIIDPNFLGDPYDVKISIEGLRLSREIMRQPALAKYVSRVHFPDDCVKSQGDLELYVRKYGRTSYHPVGTCKMGTDAMAVVDPKLRVIGIEGLRICDSSIMPQLVSSNTNAASIMIGEKASDLILGTHV